MTRQFYIPYFAISPYGDDVPAKVMEAAATELENQLGCAWQVLAAKAAFEEAGGLQAFSRGIYPSAITRWSLAAQAALDAAYLAEPPLQASIDDIDQLNAAHLDIIPAALYGYTEDEWLNVFTAHFGMSDHCDSHRQAVAAGRRWLAIAPGACPIAAADQEIRRRCQPERLPADWHAAAGQHSRALQAPELMPAS